MDVGGGDDIPWVRGKLGERVVVRGKEKPDGGLVELGGGEEIEGQWVEVGGGEEIEGQWVEVGELAAEEEGVVDRSRAPALMPTGELSESLREWTGEEVRGGMERGGGQENLRHRRGDLLLRWSPPHVPWLVAKNSSKDLKGGRKGGEGWRKEVEI